MQKTIRAEGNAGGVAQFSPARQGWEQKKNIKRRRRDTVSKLAAML